MDKLLYSSLVNLPSQLPILLQGSLLEHLRFYKVSRNFLMHNLFDFFFKVKKVPFIVVPAFTFSVFKTLKFNPKMPSEIGFISAFVESNTKFIRTSHPMYSFYCVINPVLNIEEPPQIADNYYCFGPKSFYNYLVACDAVQVCLNLPDSKCMTFYHHAEKIVGATHRNEKIFNVEIDSESKKLAVNCSVFVRRDGVITDVTGIESLMWEKRIWSGARPIRGVPTERWAKLDECLGLFHDLDVSQYKELLYRVG